MHATICHEVFGKIKVGCSRVEEKPSLCGKLIVKDVHYGVGTNRDK